MSFSSKVNLIGGSVIRGLGYLLFILGIIILITILISMNFFVIPIIVLLLIGISTMTFIGFVFMGLYIIPEWIKIPTLLLGKYKKMRGPGIMWLFPFIYKIPFALDMRIITTTFSAEQTLTKDNVPVNVDAVLFWKVVDPYKAS
ncbi:MAG: SPFH domain-containing protein, partial [Promethearchaeota archaeon]